MGTINTQTDPNTRLLYALAEELKLPFMQIARSAELGRLTDTTSGYNDIETTADAALKLLDGYVLSSHTLINQVPLKLESVPLTSTMYDTAQHLYKLTKLYGANVDIQVEGKCGLVMAHPEGLKAALTSLVYTFISSIQDSSSKQVSLYAHNTKDGVVAGVLSSKTTLNKKSLESARKLYGNARQPAVDVTHGSGAGLYVADSLFSAMNSSLRFSKFANKRGLVATLLPSGQLSLL